MIPSRSLLLFFILIFVLYSAQVFAFSVAGSVSDYVFSSCKSFGNDEKHWNTLKGVLNPNSQTCKPADTFLYDVNTEAEEMLFDKLTRKQIQHQQCQRTQLQGFTQMLENDPEFEDYIHSKLKVQLANLRGMEYRLARMKMALEDLRSDCGLAQALPFVSDGTAQLYRDGSLSVNYSCPAKRMTPESAENLVFKNFSSESQLGESIQELESQLAVLKAQIPFAAAPKIQDLMESQIREARGQARQDQVSGKNSILDLEFDVQLQAKLDNENFAKVEKALPNKKAVRDLYKEYDERLKKSQAELEGTKTRAGRYEPDDDQKRQIFKGPTGSQFVAETLVSAKEENVEDVKNMLCRLDAHYGSQRNKTEAYRDIGLGAATIVLTGLEMMTGVGTAPAAVTGPMAIYRLKSAINVISNSKYVQYGIVASAGASAAVGVVQTIEKCKAPMAQVKECKPYSKENLTAEMKLSACLTSAGMALIGGGGLAVASLRNTNVGRDALEKLTKLNFQESFMANLKESKNLKSLEASPAAKKLVEVPEYRDLALAIEKGDVSGIARLSQEQQVEFLTAYHQHNRMRIDTAQFNLKKTNLSSSEKKQLQAELSHAQKNRAILNDVLRSVTRREVSYRLTAQAKFSVETVQKFEKILRAGGAGRNVTKEED